MSEIGNMIKQQTDQMLSDWSAAARSACTKETVEELTQEEKFALCLFSGAPIDSRMEGTMMTWFTARKCGFYKHDGRWTVVIEPPPHSFEGCPELPAP